MAETSTPPTPAQSAAAKALSNIATQIEEYKALKDQVQAQIGSGNPVLAVTAFAQLPGDNNNRLAALAADIGEQQADTLNSALMTSIDDHIDALTTQYNAQLAIVNG